MCYIVHVHESMYILKSSYMYVHVHLYIIISIKNNEIEGWSRDGRIKKYTNKIYRDNHIHYTSLRLLLSIIMYMKRSYKV